MPFYKTKISAANSADVFYFTATTYANVKYVFYLLAVSNVFVKTVFNNKSEEVADLKLKLYYSDTGITFSDNEFKTLL